MTGLFFFFPDASRMTELDKTGKQMSVEALPLSPVGGVVKDLRKANLRGRKFMG